MRELQKYKNSAARVLVDCETRKPVLWLFWLQRLALQLGQCWVVELRVMNRDSSSVFERCLDDEPIWGNSMKKYGS